ncbi:hypothetical protein CLU85_4013 [Acidovorax sp. 69]|nr:hypothetical protein CLU85_4013 [Acidovorax sp. 69]
MRVTFFCFAKRKLPKKRRPPVCDPHAVRGGKPASGRLRGAPWNSLCAARAARTTTASQFTRHARSDARVHPATAPPQAQPAGVRSPTAEQPHGPSLRSAQAAQREAPARSGPSAAMARMDVRSPGFPSGCAEERSGQRIRARDCLSATQWSEFERDPAGREHRRLPAAKRRDAACRVAFSLVAFFWRSKRKPLRRRAHTPASALCIGVRSSERTASTSSARTGGAGAQASTSPARAVVVAHTLRQTQPHR